VFLFFWNKKQSILLFSIGWVPIGEDNQSFNLHLWLFLIQWSTSLSYLSSFPRVNQSSSSFIFNLELIVLLSSSLLCFSISALSPLFFISFFFLHRSRCSSSSSSCSFPPHLYSILLLTSAQAINRRRRKVHRDNEIYTETTEATEIQWRRKLHKDDDDHRCLR